MLLSKLIFRKSLTLRQHQRLVERSTQFYTNFMKSPYRAFSSKPEEAEKSDEKDIEPEEKTEEEPKHEEAAKPESKETDDDSESSIDEEEEYVLKAKDIKNLLKDQDEEIDILKRKLDNAIKQYKVQLAENDNTVKRYKEEVKKAQEFAISKFAKDMLEVRDNLQMAIDHAKKLNIEEEEEIDNCKQQFSHLFHGVDMTNTVFDKIMKRHNVIEYKPIGEKFDPNIHEAVTMVDDPSRDPNTI